MSVIERIREKRQAKERMNHAAYHWSILQATRIMLSRSRLVDGMTTL